MAHFFLFPHRRHKTTPKGLMKPMLLGHPSNALNYPNTPSYPTKGTWAPFRRPRPAFFQEAQTANPKPI